MKATEIIRMKKVAALAAVALAVGLTTQAQLIDDFSGSLSAYTDIRILNNANHSPVNTYSWEISGGALQLNTTAFVGIEQYGFTRTDNPLGVGYELIATFGASYTGTQDIGLYVGAGTPTVDIRQDYVDVYVRNNGQIFSRGFDGTTEFTLGGGATPANIDSLFVARTASDTFELGYYDGATRNIISTRTISNGNAVGIGSSIGFYADVRAAGIVGSLDNLQIVPEPSTLALLGLGGLACVFRLRRRS